MIFEEFADDLVILCHSAAPLSDLDWTRFTDYLHERVTRTGGIPHSLVWTEGGGPNAKQRLQAKERVLSFERDGASRTAVLTRSAVVRGMVTAMAWLGRKDGKFRTFAPSQLPQALQFLGVRHDPVILEERRRLLAAKLDGSEG